MLYRRNFETPERFRASSTRLEEALGPPAPDHHRPRGRPHHHARPRASPSSPTTSPRAPRATRRFVERQGLIEGRELRRLGVDVNFAPGARRAHRALQPEHRHPLLRQGPGAGRRASAPRASAACRRRGSRPAPSTSPARAMRRWTRTWACPSSTPTGARCTPVHLPPFLAAMEAGVDCIMTSHPLYPSLDPAPRMPATFSRLIVDGLPARRGRLPRRHRLRRSRDGRDRRALPDRRGDGAHRGGRATISSSSATPSRPSAPRTRRSSTPTAPGRCPSASSSRACARLDALAARRPERFAGGAAARGARRRAAGPRHGHARGRRVVTPPAPALRPRAQRPGRSPSSRACPSSPTASRSSP